MTQIILGNCYRHTEKCLVMVEPTLSKQKTTMELDTDAAVSVQPRTNCFLIWSRRPHQWFSQFTQARKYLDVHNVCQAAQATSFAWLTKINLNCKVGFNWYVVNYNTECMSVEKSIYFHELVVTSGSLVPWSLILGSTVYTYLYNSHLISICKASKFRHLHIFGFNCKVTLKVLISQSTYTNTALWFIVRLLLLFETDGCHKVNSKLVLGWYFGARNH